MVVLQEERQRVEEKVRSPLSEHMQQFFQHKLAAAGSILVALFILLAIFAPLIAPYGLNDQSLSERLAPPSAEHFFGTDDFGRDIFSRVIYGARLSLWVGFFSCLGSAVAGTILGLIAGFYGKWADGLISRMFDIMLAFPSILLAIAIVAILGPSLENALIAIAIINIPTFGRLVRSKVLSIRQEEYILSARAVGMSNFRMMFKHILPNSMAPVIVQATLNIGTAIIEAAALGFLGLGAQAPNPEWGKMLADARPYLAQAPWTLFFPGISIMLAVLGFNLMGDGLRDTLDPKMKEGK
ncbi:ABC transporter permease [Bacillus sonorensis]|uniref:Dipeptide/oligopeptide ABC transporter permease n=2 Tax=Bacillus sonorensis TaxID=119858 RepID=M5P0A2_9BACI|nr:MULTISPECIES: ABC transporter permease [Bacillus]TWK77050.1 Glutathione transport system permease protein GsiD [Bacillus paralicheniformis]ASB87647.1 putative D,D-dipeptide transport system permease protein DdpC [Bacillus sonorensis]EME72843.1 dipeptide/oligopeptide ABC transporter permease [Bacillus sonorensis L12]MBG9916414.1 peptide ABC transporter permease [Bacillus sonorensis]MCF7617096.1 ABC transporter permease [Bacillus sonorensis]